MLGHDAQDVLVKGSRWTWLLGCLTMPMLIVRLGQFTISDLSFLVSGGLLALSVSRHRPRVSWTWPLAAVLAVLSAGLALYNSLDPGDNALVAARLVYLWLIWRWQARSLLDRPQFVRHTLVAFIAGASLSGLVAAGQVVLGLNAFGTGLTGRYSSRAAGLAEHVNDQGGQLAVAVAFAAALLINGELRRRTSILLLTGVCVVGLVLCGSVTGMAAALVALLLLLLRARVSLKRRIQLALLLAGGLFASVYLQAGLVHGDPLDRLTSATGQNGDTSTLAIRLHTWAFAWSGIRSSPVIGHGLDLASGATYDGVTLTHNVFLLYWYQGGAPLLCALVLTLAVALPNLLVRTTVSRSLHEAAVGGTVAALVYAQTAPVMFQRYFWLPVILLVVLADQRRRRGIAEPVPDTSGARRLPSCSVSIAPLGPTKTRSGPSLSKAGGAPRLAASVSRRP